MANINAPFGLRATRSLGSMNCQVNDYIHAAGDSTALFIGDAVVTTGAGTSTNPPYPDGTPIVTASGSVTTGNIRGAVQGFFPTLTNLTIGYCPASTLLGVRVHDDPMQLFAIQSDGTVASGDVSANVSLLTGTGSTFTNLSGYQAHESNVAPGTAYVLRIIRLLPTVNNALGANGIFEVKINNHELLASLGN